MPNPSKADLFAVALRRRSWSVLRWSVPFWLVVVPVAAIPWAKEGEPAKTTLLHWLDAAAAGDLTIPGWIVGAVFPLLAVSALWITWRGVAGLTAPGRSGPYRRLAKLQDPEAAIAAFEAELPAAAVRIDRPLVVATPSWLFFQNGPTLELIPTSDIVWAHGAKDSSGAVVGGAFQLAGMINAKTRREIVGQDAMDLVLHRRSDPLPERLAVDAGIGALLDYFMRFQPHVIVGFTSELKAAWDKDPKAFVAEAVQPSQAMAIDPDDLTGAVETLLTTVQLGQGAADLVDKIGEGLAADADARAVIAPFGAAVDLAKGVVEAAKPDDDGSAPPSGEGR